MDRARAVAGPYVDVTADLATALARPDVHAIAIATPARTHRAIAAQALAAGKHVLVEKPLADSGSRRRRHGRRRHSDGASS